MEKFNVGDRVRVVDPSNSGHTLEKGQEFTISAVKLDNRGEPSLLGFDTKDGHMAWKLSRFEKVDTWTWGDIEVGDKVTFSFKGETFKATAYSTYNGVGLLGFTVRDIRGSLYGRPPGVTVLDLEKKIGLPTTVGSRVRAGGIEYILLNTAITPVATWTGAAPAGPIWVAVKGKFTWSDGPYIRQLRYTVLHDAGKESTND